MTMYVQGLWPKDIIVSGIVTKDLEKKIGANFVLRFSFGPFQHKEFNETVAYFKDYNTTPVTNFQFFFLYPFAFFCHFLLALLDHGGLQLIMFSIIQLLFEILVE